MSDCIARILEVFRGQDDFLISTHLYPDGDAISSELALHRVMRKLGRRATIVNDSPTSDLYDFLPGREAIHTLADWSGNGAFPTLVSLDSGRNHRLGRVLPRFQPRRIINIDHHVSNDHFGEINWVDPGASSTGELVLDLAVAAGVEVDLEIATCVYTAILSDTGCFCYANATARAHEIAARMIALGVDPAEISGRLYRSRSLGQVRLQAALVDTLELSPDGRVAWATLSHEMCRRAGARMIEALDSVLLPISLAGVVLGVLFRECDEPGRIKVSLRSEAGLDVSLLARALGGGGHPCASGATLEGSLAEVRARVVPRLLAELDGPRAAPSVAIG